MLPNLTLPVQTVLSALGTTDSNVSYRLIESFSAEEFAKLELKELFLYNFLLRFESHNDMKLCMFLALLQWRI